MKLKSYPLYSGSQVVIKEPTLDFFTQKIQKQESFSLVRSQSEWWHVIYEALKIMNNGIEIDKYDFSDPNTLDVLTQSMISQYNKIGGGRFSPHSYQVWRGCLEMMKSKKPDNFYYCVSQSHIHNKDILNDKDVPAPVSYKHLKPVRPTPLQVEKIIQGFFPDTPNLLRSTVWRKWGATGEIHDLIESLSDLPIVLVGRDVYHNFGEKLRLNNFNFIEIDGKNASPMYDSIKSQIIDLHTLLYKQGNKQIVYFMLGCDTTRLLQWDLHGVLEGNPIMLDLGRALDPYYRLDKVFVNNSGEWGHWHKSYGPWIKDRCPYVIR